MAWLRGDAGLRECLLSLLGRLGLRKQTLTLSPIRCGLKVKATQGIKHLWLCDD